MAVSGVLLNSLLPWTPSIEFLPMRSTKHLPKPKADDCSRDLCRQLLGSNMEKVKLSVCAPWDSEHRGFSFRHPISRGGLSLGDTRGDQSVPHITLPTQRLPIPKTSERSRDRTPFRHPARQAASNYTLHLPHLHVYVPTASLTMASVRQHQQPQPPLPQHRHQHQHWDPNSAHDLPSSHRPFLPTPNSTASLVLSSSVLATVRSDPILIEKAVRELPHGYVYASFEKVRTLITSFLAPAP